jgi:glycerol-3-phosphate dehydrogenase
MNRNQQLKKLQTEKFDICIIGAGASGAGAALDAALRGYKVALIDKNDFCAETSSKSTKLIHGGVRYLERAFKQLDLEQLRQVRHGLHERHTLLKLAPHLAQPIALITPVFSWLEGLYYSIGLKIYGLFALGDGMPSAKWLSKKDTLKRMPGLTQNLHSSVLYYDGTFNDAGYTLAMVLSAEKKGAAVANYVGLESFSKNEDGKLKEAFVRDEISGVSFNIKSKLFINCTGPFADSVRIMADDKEEKRMRPAKGVHMVFSSEKLPVHDAMLIPETKDGRVVFVKPLGNQVMVGTTDTAYSEMEKEPVLESNEIDYLMETVNPFLEKALTRNDVQSGFAGVRPLLGPKSTRRKETKSLLRDHEVEYLPESNLLSLLGGKWTTYRVMAKDVIDYADMIFGNSSICITADHKLIGAQRTDFNEQKLVENAAKKMEVDSINHLLENYGDEAERVFYLVQKDDSLAEKIHKNYPYIKAEVKYGIALSMVTKMRDFFARRIRLEIMDWNATLASIDAVGSIFQTEMGWSDDELLKNKKEYEELLNEFKRRASIL